MPGVTTTVAMVVVAMFVGSFIPTVYYNYIDPTVRSISSGQAPSLPSRGLPPRSIAVSVVKPGVHYEPAPSRPSWSPCSDSYSLPYAISSAIATPLLTCFGGNYYLWFLLPEFLLWCVVARWYTAKMNELSHTIGVLDHRRAGTWGYSIPFFNFAG